MSKNNCDKYLPLPTVINNPSIKRIIAIGDVHGDMELAINFLLLPKLIEEVDINNYKTAKIKERTGVQTG
jgi:hypothetical protein